MRKHKPKNAFAKALENRIFRRKVIASKKRYNRKKISKETLKDAD